MPPPQQALELLNEDDLKELKASEINNNPTLQKEADLFKRVYNLME